MQMDSKQHVTNEALSLGSLPLLEPDFDETYDEIQAEIFASAWDE